MRAARFFWGWALALLVTQAASSQTPLTGVVRDKATGQPLAGVNVQVLGTTLGAATDPKGRFVIPRLPTGRYDIRASRIGYRTEVQKGVAVMPEGGSDLLFELEEAPLEMDPIVVLGGKTAQRLDQSPVPLSVLTYREIEARAPVNLVQALETAPGVHFVGDQISIRGSTGYTFGAGNKVLLLLDGVPVYASDTGAFNWDVVAPQDIERIEVQKGAGSTLWGGSALGGVVNLITRSPEPGGRVRVSVQGGLYDQPYYREWRWADPYSQYDTRMDASYSRQAGGLGLRLSAARRYSTGYTELGKLDNLGFTAKADVRFGGAWKATAYAAFSRMDRGYFVQWKDANHPYEVDEANLGNRAVVNQLNLYAKVAVAASSRLALELRVSAVRSLMGNEFGTTADFKPALGQGAELQATWIPSPSHTVTAGLQLQLDKGSAAYFGSHQGVALGPYVEDQWRVRENLRLTAGLRYDRYRLAGGRDEDLLSPRIGLNYEPRPGTVLRASAGSGFRAATIVERFLELSIMNFHIVANPGLRAERCWTLDAGIRHYLGPDWVVDLSVFDSEYTDLIEAHLNLIRGQIQFRNVASAQVAGVEVASRWAGRAVLFSRAWMPSIEVNVTAMDHRNVDADEPLPYRPPVIGSVKASLGTGPWHVEGAYRYAARIQEVKVYPINARVAMHFVDLRARWERGPLTVQAGIQNLLQYNYAPMESNLMPPRTFTLGLTVTR